MKKQHWLYGEHEYKEDVQEETKCSLCIHKNVCNVDKEKRCSNFDLTGGSFSDINLQGCFLCGHRYTKSDKKDPILCFHCKDFQFDFVKKFGDNPLFKKDKDKKV